jgi:large subunit ribosomal protein L6
VSRIGKLPVAIPAGVKVAVEASAVRLEGPKGKLQAALPAGVEVKVEGNVLRVERQAEESARVLPASWISTESATAPR